MRILPVSDPVAAEVELRKALSLGVPDAQVLPDLARAMLFLGQPNKITEQFALITLPEPVGQADLRTTVAAAYVQQREPGRADEALATALRAQPSYPPALMLLSSMKAAKGDIDGALEPLDRILSRDPGNAQAGVAKGYVFWLGRQDGAAALQAHRKVLEAHPDNVPARAEVVTILFREGQRDDARQQFELLKKQAPKHPETMFFDAQFAYVDKEYKRARTRRRAAECVARSCSRPRTCGGG
jgi:Tfp pilus assembly protein PilF